MLRKVLSINWFKFISLNFLSSKVKRKGKGYIIPYWNSIIDLAKGSVIEIYGDENFHVNYHKPQHSKSEAYIKMLENSKLIIRGNVVLNYKATIEVHKNAIVEIGKNVIINSGAVILAADSIKIGDECLISREVYIYDSDHHKIFNDEGKQSNQAMPVTVGNHVWIGLKCTLLRGSNIGEGSMIAAGSVVGGKIKEGVMAQGNPARPFANIKWEI